jgi:hypothetical protein
MGCAPKGVRQLEKREACAEAKIKNLCVAAKLQVLEKQVAESGRPERKLVKSGGYLRIMIIRRAL